MPLKAMEVEMISSKSSKAVMRVEDDTQACKQRANHRNTDARHHRLDGAGEVQSEDQLQPGDGSYQVALVHASCFVVDIEHASADHHRHIHRERDRAGEQILHVLDVRVELDDLERDLLHHLLLNDGSIQGVDQGLHFCFQTAAHGLVAVVDHQADGRRIAGQDAARILRRDDHRSVDFAGAHVFSRLLLIVIGDRGEGADIDGDGVEGLFDFERLRAAIVIDNAHARAANLAAEGVAQDNQLDQRQGQSTPSSTPASEKTSASPVPRLPSFASWLHPRTRRHNKAQRLDLFVTQLTPRVVHEDIVERGVLYGE